MSWLDAHPMLNRWSNLVARTPVVGSLWSRVLRVTHSLGTNGEMERFCKFAAVGCFGAIVDFTVLNLCKWLFEKADLGVGWNAALPPHQIQLVAANVISFSAAVLSNFTWNRLWTFPESRERALGGQLFKFAVVNILGLAINTLILVFVDHLLSQFLVSDRLSYNLAKAFAIAVVLFWNYGINRIWTYRGIE